MPCTIFTCNYALENTFKRTKPLQLTDDDYKRGFFHNTTYDVPNEPDMENLFNADITIINLVGFCDAAYANDLQNQRSTNVVVFIFMGGAIIYKSKP